jgi:hypothetical protein
VNGVHRHTKMMSRRGYESVAAQSATLSARPMPQSYDSDSQTTARGSEGRSRTRHARIVVIWHACAGRSRHRVMSNKINRFTRAHESASALVVQVDTPAMPSPVKKHHAIPLNKYRTRAAGGPGLRGLAARLRSMSRHEMRVIAIQILIARRRARIPARIGSLSARTTGPHMLVPQVTTRAPGSRAMIS